MTKYGYGDPRPFDHLTPEGYLKLFVEQTSGIATDMTCTSLQAFIQRVVLNSSEALEQSYRNSKAISGTLSMAQYGELLVDLKNTIGGRFEVTEQTEALLRLKTTRCPFGDLTKSAPALCHMTSSIFGGIAARNYGYAKVELRQRIALGSDHCDICIYRTPSNAESIVGDEYFSDGVKVIAEVRAPSELQKRIEERLHSLWLNDDNRHHAYTIEPPRLIAESQVMHNLLKSVEIVAPTRVPVLLCGETGVGKEVIAKAIHAMSPRHKAAFIAVNCGSIPVNLVEAELFGYEAGAFTDAKRSCPGRFELADGGTLFLDEVDSLSAKAQVSLLRVLQEHRFERLGGRKTIACDVRVICATNRNLEEQVEAGNFRQDLFYRLNVVPLYIPPLRERPDDLEPLVKYLLERFAERYQDKPKQISQAAFCSLRRYSWPGNVRELENILERSYLFADGELIHRILFDLNPAANRPVITEEGVDLKSARRDAANKVEREILEQALIQFEGDVKEMARFLNLSPRAVYQKLAAHGLPPKPSRVSALPSNQP